ncbi:MAG: BatD family protein [Puniceicoccales bacterium]|jgi:hypothetical protein|nr:BatD family protein [Puniceicoccales bacterium]
MVTLGTVIQKSFGKMKIQFFTVLIAFLQMSTLNARSPSISINARFEPTEANLYKEVRYVVDITNAFPHDFSPPAVPGLRKRGESVYQSSTMINGVRSQKVSFIFSYIPEKTGTIEIPEYTIEVNGDRYPVMPAKLKITNNSNAVPQQQDQSVILTVAIDSARAYVGQNIPATISLRLDEDIQLLGPIKPQILSEAFLQSPISKQPRLRSDRGYEIYSWDTFITPLKSGNYQIAFEASCPIQVMRAMGFFSLAEQESIHLVSLPTPLEVHPLSQAPTDFRGGIGQFSLKNLRLSSDRALVGEPITLSVDIVGEGNFARLQPPEIASGEQWKIFPPKTTFIPQDDHDLKGIKTIEYIIVPQKTGEVTVPDITLTYFNPKTEQFETSNIDNAKKIVLVSRSTETFPNYDRGTVGENKTNDESKSENSVSALHILSKDTPCYTTLKPIYFQSWFWILQGCLAMIALLLFVKTRTPLLREKKPKWNVKKIEKRLLQTINTGNGEQFYGLAAQFIAQKLAIYSIDTKQRSEQMKQLQERGVKHLKWLETFLNEADAIAFGQSQVDKKHVNQQLEKLMMFLKQE